MATLSAITVATTRDGIDELRTSTAARYLGARLMYARIDAVKRSTCIALRFEPASDDYRYATYHDGNGNGVRTVDIGAHIDLPLTPAELLRDKFPGVRFELMPNVPDADGAVSASRDGVRIGAARILTMSPDGTATAGTLYLHGRRSQYAVRVVGATGRVRVLQYRAATKTWVTR
jgi:type II secretion system GspH-like protein